jgi:hypothetical protein
VTMEPRRPLAPMMSIRLFLSDLPVERSSSCSGCWGGRRDFRSSPMRDSSLATWSRRSWAFWRRRAASSSLLLVDAKVMGDN